MQIVTAAELNRSTVEALKWYALYTRSRHEKFIQAELGKKGIEAFLPVRYLKRKWSDRIVTAEEPLFKSYVFVKSGQHQFLNVLQTKGAVKFVSAGIRPVAVSNSVIESLRYISTPEAEIDYFPYLNTGDRVYVRSGVFKGVEGYIARKDDDKYRVIISVDALMASISVQVDSNLVEKL